MYAAKYHRIAGDPGFFGSIGKAIGGAVKGISRIGGIVGKVPVLGGVLRSPIGKIASKFVPGLGIASTALSVGGIAKSVGGRLLAGRAGGFGMKAIATGGGASARGIGGALAGGAAVGTAGGLYGAYKRELEAQGMTPAAAGSQARAITGRRYRRMNPMNARAARRAIRRIRAVRKITADIERQLPRARATRPKWAFQRRRKRAA